MPSLAASKMIGLLLILGATTFTFSNDGDVSAMAKSSIYLDALNPLYSYISCVVDSAPITVTGEYTFVPNPCTTKPCLPGFIFALQVNETYYYLMVEGQWLWETQSWDGFVPQVGQTVKVSGEISEQIDTAGQVFYNLEVISLYPIDRSVRSSNLLGFFIDSVISNSFKYAINIICDR
ncbi:MAG: hypothetical protein AB4038_03785 [Prochloraceae cyanobacterium]